MTDADRLAALRSVRATGHAPEAHREQLKQDGLIAVRGSAMLRWLCFDLTPLGLCDLERLGAAEVAALGLRVWRNDVIEFFVASSAEDAAEFLTEQRKQEGSDPPDEDDAQFSACPDDKLLTIYLDTDEGQVTKTAAEWCVANGRGFLCSTEY
jgi:hypothetical protein